MGSLEEDILRGSMKQFDDLQTEAFANLRNHGNRLARIAGDREFAKSVTKPNAQPSTTDTTIPTGAANASTGSNQGTT